MPRLDATSLVQTIENGGDTLEKLSEYLSEVTAHGQIRLPLLTEDLRIAEIDIRLYMKSLYSMTLARSVYDDLPGATVDMKIMSSQLHKGHWIPAKENGFVNRKTHLSRTQKLACIAMFESGAYNLVPNDLDEVMAICSRNTIYVSEILLQDPFHTSHANDVTIVMGNVGRADMAIMVAPPAPRVKEAEIEKWNQVLHAPFDSTSEDNFASTSVYLSFTDYQMPFDVGNRGGIDNDLYFVETLISVLDRGKWVADLDVLALHRAQQILLRRGPFQEQCTKHASSRIPKHLTSFNTWEEILDTPERLVRALLARSALKRIGWVDSLPPASRYRKVIERYFCHWAMSESHAGLAVFNILGCGT
jgi:hypothetical protein